MLKSTKLLFLFAILAAAFVSWRSSESPIRSWQRQNDFAHYYISSKLWLVGENPYQADLSSTYKPAGLVNIPKITQVTNPPALIVLLAPLTIFHPQTAFWMWTCLQACSLVIALLLLFRLLMPKLTGLEQAIFICSTFAIYPVTYHLERGQTQLLILALIVLGIYTAERCGKKGILIGMAVWGLATSLKLFTWPLIFVGGIFFGLPGLLSFILGAASLNLLAISTTPVGLSVVEDFFTKAIPYVQNSIGVFNGSNGLLGAIIHTLQVFDDTTASYPLDKIGQLSQLITILLFASLVFFRRILQSNIYSSVSTALILALIFSPTTWSHYLPLTFIALVYLLSRTRLESKTLLNYFNLIICYLLIAFSQGRLRKGELIWQLTTSWLGVFALVFTLTLVIKATNQRSD